MHGLIKSHDLFRTDCIPIIVIACMCTPNLNLVSQLYLKCEEHRTLCEVRDGGSIVKIHARYGLNFEGQGKLG
jgi:hypothetical protein